MHAFFLLEFEPFDSFAAKSEDFGRPAEKKISAGQEWNSRPLALGSIQFLAALHPGEGLERQPQRELYLPRVI
jgi:hypothetical protein